MYKDKHLQKEANRQASKKRRELIKRYREGMTITLENVIPVIPKTDIPVIPSCDTPDVIPKRSYIGAVPETPDTTSPKRGKDIKCFADLPPDVQKTIDRMSINKDGTINQTTKANRTAIAIHYQHLFPDRYYSTGVA